MMHFEPVLHLPFCESHFTALATSKIMTDKLHHNGSRKTQVQILIMTEIPFILSSQLFSFSFVIEDGKSALKTCSTYVLRVIQDCLKSCWVEVVPLADSCIAIFSQWKNTQKTLIWESSPECGTVLLLRDGCHERKLLR